MLDRLAVGKEKVPHLSNSEEEDQKSNENNNKGVVSDIEG